ncbi:Hypothetical predicted protein [Mytilus galloprovincialis]|uniref:Mesoderm development candidate 2 n=1 Tax=Mytilus galloprovincialis TaxID=29158 RepID=A0A8B6DX88_MYTGA|nr:Hypothetical predicted protein [Mytilus galloprovincialis]
MRAGTRKLSYNLVERRWRWIGHVLMMDTNSICSVALTWKPEGKRKAGRPKTTCRRTVETKRTSFGQKHLHGLQQEQQLKTEYVVGSNRVIFMLTDGSKAWEVKDFLTQQERCEEVTIEGKSYPGKGQKSEESSDKKNNVDSSKNKIKDKSKSESESNKKSTKEKDIDDNRTERKKTEL